MLWMYLCRWEKFWNAKRERAQSSCESLRWCAFLLNKGKEGGGKKESVSVGIASGHHTLSARERERQRSRGASCHLSISPLQVLFILLFSLHLFTQIVFLSTSLLFKSCVSQCECALLLWKLKRGDNEASKLQISLFVFRLSKLSLSFFIYCTITVQFMLVLVQWNVCLLLYALFFKHFCAPATTFSLHAYEIVCCIPTEQMMEISFCSSNSQWFTLTAASETLAQSHFRRTGWESQEFIYSLYPLNPFHSHQGLWKDHQSVSQSVTRPSQIDKRSLSSYSHSDSYLTTFPGVWEGNSVMRKPMQTPHRLGIEHCEAAE